MRRTSSVGRGLESFDSREALALLNAMNGAWGARRAADVNGAGVHMGPKARIFNRYDVS